MNSTPRRRPSPAMIVAMIALCLGLGGSAIAANGDITKKQVKKIAKKQANKVINKKAPTLSVASAANAANATTADSTRAFAYIASDGTVSQAKNIGQANVSHPDEGIYCFDLPFNPAGGHATGTAEGAAWLVFVADADSPDGLSDCPDGTEFEVNTYDDILPGEFVDADFYVSLYQ